MNATLDTNTESVEDLIRLLREELEGESKTHDDAVLALLNLHASEVISDDEAKEALAGFLKDCGKRVLSVGICLGLMSNGLWSADEVRAHQAISGQAPR